MRRRSLPGVGAMLLLATLLGAAEIKPVAGPGATREEVIAAYGWPSGQSQAETKEILTYPQGRITLVNGRVEQVDFAPGVAWPTPKPRPAPPTAVKPRPPKPANPAPPTDYWGTSYPEAVREATARHARILALFTGSDWSPPSKSFRTEVALREDFVTAVLGDFVLLQLDFPAHTAQPKELRTQNARLRERYGVTTYPSLLVLSASGERVGVIELAKLDGAAQVIAAVADVKKQLAQKAAGTKAPGLNAGAAEAGDTVEAEPEADFLRLMLLAGAVVLLAAIWLLLRRQRLARETEAVAVTGSGQTATPADIAGWTPERLRDVCAAVFEMEGYRVKLRPATSGAELGLQRSEAENPLVLVQCLSGRVGGLVGAKVARELLGTMVAEGVEQGWIVAPGGFTAEARKFAGEHGIVLISSEELLQRLGELPPMARLRVLAVQ